MNKEFREELVLKLIKFDKCNVDICHYQRTKNSETITHSVGQLLYIPIMGDKLGLQIEGHNYVYNLEDMISIELEKVSAEEPLTEPLAAAKVSLLLEDPISYIPINGAPKIAQMEFDVSFVRGQFSENPNTFKFFFKRKDIISILINGEGEFVISIQPDRFFTLKRTKETYALVGSLLSSDFEQMTENQKDILMGTFPYVD